MDEAAYRSARGEINRLPCVFEKALLARCAVCQLASHRALAERETIACTSPVAIRPSRSVGYQGNTHHASVYVCSAAATASGA